MSLLTDDDKLGIAETVVHMDFTESFTDCINRVCELAEAATITKLAGVNLEPVAWARRDDEGHEFDMVFLDKAECQSYLDDDESPEGLHTASQFVAARKRDSALLRQALVALQSLRYRSIGPDVPDEAIAAIEKRLGQL